jgi:hypothetical protein
MVPSTTPEIGDFDGTRFETVDVFVDTGATHFRPAEVLARLGVTVEEAALHPHGERSPMVWPGRVRSRDRQPTRHSAIWEQSAAPSRWRPGPTATQNQRLSRSWLSRWPRSRAMTAPTDHLTGFPAAAGSAVVKLLAERLGWRAVDTDELIAMTPVDDRAIFQDEAKAPEPSVPDVAGAGDEAHCRCGWWWRYNLRRVAAFGRRAGPPAPGRRGETIVARLTADAMRARRCSRARRVMRIRKLKAQRAALYALADFTVHTDGLTARRSRADQRSSGAATPGRPAGAGRCPD